MLNAAICPVASPLLADRHFSGMASSQKYEISNSTCFLWHFPETVLK